MKRVKDVIAEWAGISVDRISDNDDLCDVLARGPSALKCSDAKQDLLNRLNSEFPGTGLTRRDLDLDAKTVIGLDTAINNNLP